MKNRIKILLSGVVIWWGSFQVVYATEAQNNLKQFTSSLCPIISDFASTVMKTRQKRMPPEEAKKLIGLGLKAGTSSDNMKAITPMLEATMGQMVDEVQYFPVYTSDAEIKNISEIYTEFVLNRCKANMKKITP
ncbi:MAG: hypothetical protein LKF82_02805 [Acinetobacter populi]|jgi:hypothetical protein|uniref:hypothetical protein n=1 Tax=Acinetobacter populi TaxID=1582270 RepID=UPI0023539E5A|nr:hypothetical protein [Acinetobacter populi]MCH4246761.1 hypothetical protein [Acinetobacter populi]